jgi:hypothetical protein
MSEHSLATHRQSLEDSFFQKQDQELLDYLRAQSQETEVRHQLQTIAGIEDSTVLAALERIGITPESMTALTLLPLVRMAWADAKVQGAELEAILQAAREEGLTYETPGYKLLDGWLIHGPDQKVLEAWWNYARALTRELDEASLAAVRDATLGRARRIAAASGGILGLVHKISDNEQLVLDDLARAFEKVRELQ